MSTTTDEQWRRWKKATAEGFRGFGAPDDVDTVGAVALDEYGRLAAACSTGGLFGKLPGRVGDAAIYGAGMYATSRVAVVGTGLGELFLQTSACREAGELVAEGMEPQAVVESIVKRLCAETVSPVALLALDSSCRVGAAFSGRSWVVDGFGSELLARKLG